MTKRGVVATTAITHPCDPPPLCLVRIVKQAIGVSEHLGSELGRQVLHWQTIVCVGAKDLRRLVHERRMRHGGHLEATHMVIHGDVEAQVCLDWRGTGWAGSAAGTENVTRTGIGRSFSALAAWEGCVVLVEY